jgi:hypothetical protein
MIKSKELAFCGLLGAAALTIPFLFHIVHLGKVFMPMYLPLMLLAIYVRPMPAAMTAMIIPIMSGLLTGMPPFYPPIALLMSIEIAFMAALLSGIRQTLRNIPLLVILVPVLTMGRVLQYVSIYLLAKFYELPAQFIASASLISGLPGLILICVTLPLIERLYKHG